MPHGAFSFRLGSVCDSNAPLLLQVGERRVFEPVPLESHAVTPHFSALQSPSWVTVLQMSVYMIDAHGAATRGSLAHQMAVFGDQPRRFRPTVKTGRSHRDFRIQCVPVSARDWKACPTVCLVPHWCRIAISMLRCLCRSTNVVFSSQFLCKVTR